MCFWDSRAELMERELTLEGALEAWALYAKLKLASSNAQSASSG